MRYSDAAGRWIPKVHETAGLLLLGLIVLHAPAALYHHFWRRDGTLEAMLPARMRRPQSGRKVGSITSGEPADFRQLEHLVLVADHGHLGRAAKACHDP